MDILQVSGEDIKRILDEEVNGSRSTVRVQGIHKAEDYFDRHNVVKLSEHIKKDDVRIGYMDKVHKMITIVFEKMNPIIIEFV